MSGSETTHRRGFLGRILGAAAVASFPIGSGGQASAQQGGPDDWLNKVKGPQPLSLRFPAASGGRPAAAHPELPEYLSGGIQGAGRTGRGGWHVLRHRRTIQHLAGLQRRRVGEVRARRLHRPEGNLGQGLYAQSVLPPDRRRAAPADAGDADAEHSDVRRGDARARDREPAENGHDVSPLRECVRAGGARNSKRAARVRPRISRRTCAPT